MQIPLRRWLGKLLPPSVKKLLKPKQFRRTVLQRLPHVVHVGNRAICKRVLINGVPHLRKTFARNEIAMACYEREIAARELFKGYPWLTPVVKKGDGWFIVPMYSDQDRLDHLPLHLDERARLHIAKEAVCILFDMFLEGYAHRDFHAKNLFLVDRQLIVTDFEVLVPYLEGNRPAFPEAYDVIGKGVESPFETLNMCYIADDPHKKSLRHVLGIPVERALEGLETNLKEGLRKASGTFHTRKGRHTCRAGRIYSSFHLPYLTVGSEEAQRDSARRIDNFRIRRDELRGKTVLDLGSNIGGVLFEIQRLHPGRCLGVEWDLDKITIASKVAAYNGLNNVSFLNANIDKLDIKTLGGPFDVVFCLAIEGHIRRKRRLYRLLSEATRQTLYFESNGTTDTDEIRGRLLETGFVHIEYLGLSDDDCIPDNNRRELLVATK